MKGYSVATSAAAAPPAKRRWKGGAVAVLALVVFSMLVPLAFLLGLHNRFPSGYFTDDRSPPDHWSRIDGLMKKIGMNLSEDVTVNITLQADGNLLQKTNNKSTGNGEHFSSQPKDTTFHSEPKDTTFHSEPKDSVFHSKDAVLPELQVPASKPLTNGGRNRKHTNAKDQNFDESKKSCQLEFGSYCLWSIEHKEAMKDSMVRRLKDQLFVARAYYPSIAKLQAQEKLSLELKQNIQEHEHMLSESISDADLPSFVPKNIEKMDQIIARAKSCTVDCNNVDRKLRQILDLTDDEAHFYTRQSAFLYRLGVQTIPKSLHCLSLRLTVEYFRSPSVDTEYSHVHKLYNPSYRHHVIFSKNILAASVAINSTVMNSEYPGNMVFHLLTDVQNYYAMKVWFSRNSYKDASINVLNFEELNLGYSSKLDPSRLTMSEEFRVSIHNGQSSMRTEYISVFGHLHFLLPEIFKNLKKVVVLDDDVVVQQDLSSLWNLDLKGKVTGAVEFCGVRMSQLKAYLGKNNYDDNSCAWMSGLNIVDLDKWREHDVTGTYQQLLQKMSMYFAPAFFSHLLGKCLRRQNPIVEVLKLGFVVLGTFALVWWPYLYSLESVIEVLSRLAPFDRGIYEDYVANFWCSTSVLVKWKRLFTVQSLKFLSFITTVTAFLPSFVQQIKAPSDHGFLYALLNSSFSFYLFSYQVHEKSILLPLLPASLLAQQEPLLFGWFMYYALLSMYPLLCRDCLLLQYIALLALSGLIFYSPSGSHSKIESSSFHRKIALLTVPLLCSFVLHFLYLTLLPPERYPFLFEALIMFLCFSQFVILSIYTNIRQWRLDCFAWSVTGKKDL